MTYTLAITDMRSDRQVFAILKASAKPLTLDEIAVQSDYSRRHVQRTITRLREQNLVQGLKDARRTVYKPVEP